MTDLIHDLIAQPERPWTSSEITLQGRIYAAYSEGVKEVGNAAFLLRRALELLEDDRRHEARFMVGIVEDILESSELSEREHEAGNTFERMKEHNIELKERSQ